MNSRIFIILIMFFFPGWTFGKSCISIINNQLFRVSAMRIGAERTKNIPKLIIYQDKFSNLVYIKNLIRDIKNVRPGSIREDLYANFRGKKSRKQIDSIIKLFFDKGLFCIENEKSKKIHIITPDEFEDIIEAVKF